VFDIGKPPIRDIQANVTEAVQQHLEVDFDDGPTWVHA
jgi:hypothetical protein